MHSYLVDVMFQPSQDIFARCLPKTWAEKSIRQGVFLMPRCSHIGFINSTNPYSYGNL